MNIQDDIFYDCQSHPMEGSPVTSTTTETSRSGSPRGASPPETGQHRSSSLEQTSSASARAKDNLVIEIIKSKEPKGQDGQILKEVPGVSGKISGGLKSLEPTDEVIQEALNEYELLEVVITRQGPYSRINFQCRVRDKKFLEEETLWFDALIAMRLEPHYRFVDYISRVYLFHNRLFNNMLNRAKVFDKDKRFKVSNLRKLLEDSIPQNIVDIRKTASGRDYSKIRSARRRESLRHNRENFGRSRYC